MKELKDNLEEIFIELRNENSKYSIKVLELEKELQKTREQLEKCESALNNYAICDDVGTVARRYFKDKQGEGQMIIVDDYSILDKCTVNGRISKKLCEKLIIPQIEKLQEQNKILREALGELIHHCRDYGITSESFAICMAVNQAVQAIEKVSKRST